ncbi:MAG: hypothetical protein ACOYLH_04975 [Flavobacteriales bacterium]
MKYSLVLVFILIIQFGWSQVSSGEQANILYNRQKYGGFCMNSQGFGGFFTYAKYQDAFRQNIFHFDLQFVKHEKEIKRFSSDPNARGYFYGKQNSFIVFHAGIGRKKVITEKLRKNGVQLSHNWIGGGSFGFTKPIYLEIFYIQQSSPDPIVIKVEKFDPEVHFIDNIYGRASSLRGLNELKFYPGAFLKWGLMVEYSNERVGLKGIEAGVQIDAFLTRIPIMSQKILEEQEDGAKNHQFFPSLYINFFFGKKYNAL